MKSRYIEVAVLLLMVMAAAPLVKVRAAQTDCVNIYPPQQVQWDYLRTQFWCDPEMTDIDGLGTCGCELSSTGPDYIVVEAGQRDVRCPPLVSPETQGYQNLYVWSSVWSSCSTLNLDAYTLNWGAGGLSQAVADAIVASNFVQFWHMNDQDWCGTDSDVLDIDPDFCYCPPNAYVPC